MPDPIVFLNSQRFGRTVDLSWETIESSSNYHINVVSGSTVISSFDTNITNGFSYNHDSDASVFFAVVSEDRDALAIASSNKAFSFSDFTMVSSVGLIYGSNTRVFASGSENADLFVITDGIGNHFAYSGFSFSVDAALDKKTTTIYAVNSGLDNFSIASSINLVDLRPDRILAFREKYDYSNIVRYSTNPSFTGESNSSETVYISFATSYQYPMETIDLVRSKKFTGKPVLIYQKNLNDNTISEMGIAFGNSITFSYTPENSGYKYQGIIPTIPYETNILERKN